jgi:hypothetical protein
MYKTLNRGITLEPKSLWIEEWLERHGMSLVEVGAKKEVMWIGGPQSCPSCRRQFLMRGI